MQILIKALNLSLLVLYPVAWTAPLMRAGILPLFKLDEISVLTGLQSLWASDIFLALVVTLFALFAPYLKTIGLALVHFNLLSARLLPVLHLVGKLAMADVFLIALYVTWDWISLSLQYQGAPVENAGMYAQIGLTVLAIGLCFYLPSNRRIMQLETSHRRFSIGMQDVARAYAAVHAADRQQTFQLSSEFDAVRERLAYLRDHPDLSTLEP